MAIYCTTQTNPIWFHIIPSFTGQNIDSLSEYEFGSSIDVIVSGPVVLDELMDICKTQPSIEIFVFFCPPALMLEHDDDARQDLQSKATINTEESESLLNFYFQNKKNVSLINLALVLDEQKLKQLIEKIPFNDSILGYRLSFESIFQYLALKSSSEKAYKIENLLNTVSFGEAPTTGALIKVANIALNERLGSLQCINAENKERLASRDNEIASLQESLSRVETELKTRIDESKSLIKDHEDEKERLTSLIHLVQERLENAIKSRESEISSITSKFEDEINKITEKYEKENRELNAQRADLKNTISNREITISEYSSSLEKVKKELSVLENALSATQNAIVEREALLEASFTEQKESLQRRNKDEISNVKNSYEKRILNLDKSCNDKLKEQKFLTEKIQSECNELLSVKKKEFLTLKVRSERQVDRLTTENEKLLKEVRFYQALYYQLKNELGAIKSSTAWKAISPVLKAKDKMMGNVSRLHQEEIISDMALLYTSELFDADWYLTTYPDVATQNIDPAKHYLLFGYKEGRRPSLNFDGDWYSNYYSDVKGAGVNPLLHYLRYGKSEGRRTSHNLLTNSGEDFNG